MIAAWHLISARGFPQFPIREHVLYLDHAAVCPLPSAGGRGDAPAHHGAGGDRAREIPRMATTTSSPAATSAASCIGCAPTNFDRPQHIRGPLSDRRRSGVGTPATRSSSAARSLPPTSRPGWPWPAKALRSSATPNPTDASTRQSIEEHITDRTRLLAVSWVAFHSGWIAPSPNSVGICRDRNILLVVDAIQGLGVLPMHMGTFGVDAARSRRTQVAARPGRRRYPRRQLRNSVSGCSR